MSRNNVKSNLYALHSWLNICLFFAIDENRLGWRVKKIVIYKSLMPRVSSQIFKRFLFFKYCETKKWTTPLHSFNKTTYPTQWMFIQHCKMWWLRWYLCKYKIQKSYIRFLSLDFSVCTILKCIYVQYI